MTVWAPQDNNVFFLGLILILLDIRLRLVHTFTGHSVNTSPMDKYTKYTIFTLWIYVVILSSTDSEERTRDSQPAFPGKYRVSFFSLFELKHSPSLPERTQWLTLHKIPLKNTEFPFGFGPTVHGKSFKERNLKWCPLLYTNICLEKFVREELIFSCSCAHKNTPQLDRMTVHSLSVVRA